MKKLTLTMASYDDIKNPTYAGGGAISVHQVAKRLSSRFTVRVVSWNHSGKTREVIDGVLYERFGLPFLSPKVGMFLYQLLLPLQLFRYPSDVWLESFTPPFTTAFLPWFTKKPVIGLVHMLAAEDMERKYTLPFHLIENAGLKQYKHIIVTSKLFEEKIRKVNSMCDIGVIANGTEVPSIISSTDRKSYILFLGRIEVDQKGLDLLLDAYDKFCKLSGKKYQLIIAGDGDTQEKQKLRRLIQKCNQRETVKCVGKVSAAVKSKLLQQAECIVVPSRFETYSLVALEALANGCALVCFALDGLSWIPAHAARKIMPYDVDAMASAMADVITQPKVSAELKKAGYAYAKKFTWEQTAKQYEKYIMKIQNI